MENVKQQVVSVSVICARTMVNVSDASNVIRKNVTDINNIIIYQEKLENASVSKKVIKGNQFSKLIEFQQTEKTQGFA